ncbi:hypothetical protein Tco_1328961 [Tanacetum coccineum]
MGATSCAPGVALHNAVEKKKKKYGSVCEENGYKFIPFALRLENSIRMLWTHFHVLSLFLLSTQIMLRVVYLSFIELVFVFRKEWELNLCLDSHPTLSGKEIDIRMDRGCDKALRPTDMLLYSWDGGLDVCVDLTGSSPLTQTRMADFAPGHAVIDATQRKRVKYEAKCDY